MTPEQIQDLIAQALQPLQDEIAALREKVASLEALQEQDVTRIYTDIAQDRKRIAKLENPPAREPSKAMIDRAEKIEKYLASKPDHRATFRLGIVYHRTREASRVWIESGCLCSLDAEYLDGRVPNWQHGISMVSFYDSSYFAVPLAIDNGNVQFVKL